MSAELPIDTLVKRVRQGDQEAANLLVQAYEPEIRREIRLRMRNPEFSFGVECSDICQSVLASFLVRLALGQYDVKTRDDLAKLLCRMVRNKVSDHVRRQFSQRRDRRRTRSLNGAVLAESLSDPNPEPSVQVALRELLDEVRDRLTPAELELADRRASGHSWNEIASELQESADAVRMRLQRGLTRVSRELGIDIC